MGPGLRVKQEGVHVAFAAGTGVLCFVDLVAHLAMQYTKPSSSVASSFMARNHLNASSMSSVDENKFKLHLYVSFPRRSESVALELFEALDEYCKHHAKTGFQLVVRLSQEGDQNTERWDADFIRREIGKIGGKNI